MMLEQRVNVDDRLTRAGIAKLERERILDSMNPDLQSALLSAENGSEIEVVIREYYAQQKAADGTTDDLEGAGSDIVV